MTLLIQYLWFGVSTGAIYAVIALGITLVYGLSRVVNFSVGAMMMVGAYVAWDVNNRVGNYAIALGAAIVAGSVLGLATERLMFRFTLKTPISGFVVSLGLIIVLEQLAISHYTINTRNSDPPFTAVFHPGGVLVRGQAIFNTGLVVIVLAVFYLVLGRSAWGRALRATADNREAAQLMGIPVKRLITATFVLGAALAGLAGWFLLTMGTISPLVGEPYVLRGFAVALVGGLGNIKGAAIAGFAIGVLESLSLGYLQPAWSDAYVLGAVILVLLVRPTGLLRGTGGAHV
jgi:branched-chain amino acid transport system permease protein